MTVYERADRIGGLLRYGIPDFKLEKWVIDRRLRILEEEGIVFKPGVDVGKDVTAKDLEKFDATVLCGGSTKARDLPIEGRDLDGIHFAMDFLTQQNCLVAGDDLQAKQRNRINAADKRVIVIGGRDTGSDCIGTSLRQGAMSVTSFEIMPMPSGDRPGNQPWPYWPMRLRTSSSHEEGGDRYWAIMTKRFVDAGGRVRSLVTVNLNFEKKDGRMQMVEVPGSEYEWPCELVLLAMGFVGPEPDGIIAQFGLELDKRGNVKTENYMSSKSGVFSAGDMRRGQSLIVWAISEGREAARAVDLYLMGSSLLPTKGVMDLPRV